MRRRIHTHTHTYTDTHMCLCVCMHMYIYTYLCMYIHTLQAYIHIGSACRYTQGFRCLGNASDISGDVSEGDLSHAIFSPQGQRAARLKASSA